MRPVRTDNGVYRPLGGEAALRVRRRTLRRVRGLRRRSVHCLLYGTSHSVQPPSRTQRRQSLRGLPASTLKRRRTASTSRHRNRDCLADTSWPQAGYRSLAREPVVRGRPGALVEVQALAASGRQQQVGGFTGHPEAGHSARRLPSRAGTPGGAGFFERGLPRFWPRPRSSRRSAVRPVRAAARGRALPQL